MTSMSDPCIQMVIIASIPIHDEGKIDIHQSSLWLRRSLNRVENDPDMIPENKKLILDFIRDCALGKTVIGRSKKKIGPATCLKYINAFRILCKVFDKSFHDVTQKDMEKFVQDLEDDRIRCKSGKPYSEETKTGLKKAIRKFWKWKDGNNRTYPELVEWIDTYVSVKDVPALIRAEVEKMIDHTADSRNRALIMVLFDSGARIEELLNVRLKKEHLFWKEEVGCYMIRLEFSKTKPRTISLPLSTKLLKSWLEVHPGKDNPSAQLFPLSYPNLRMILQRIGRKALGKRVTPHMLRHSSATYYANRLKNQYKLCYRYGWTMASNMVNRYIDREGILEVETPEIVKNDEISTANRENQALKEELSIVKESHSELGEQFQKLKEELGALGSGKCIMTLLLSLARQQKQMSEVLEEVSGRKFDVVLPQALGKARMWPVAD